MDTEEPKVTYNNECVNVYACMHVCVQSERKGMTVNMNISETNSRDSGGPQNSPETAVTNGRMHKSDPNMRV